MAFKLINHFFFIFSKYQSGLKKYIYKLLFGKHVNFGKGTWFRKGFSLITSNDGYVDIGNNCFFNRNCSIACFNSIQIGNNSIFGENVKMYDHNHKFSSGELIQSQGFKVGSIKIGNNCWIGSNVTILKDVEIGNNVVVGANCLIHKSIPSNTVVKNSCTLKLEGLRSL